MRKTEATESRFHEDRRSFLQAAAVLAATALGGGLSLPALAKENGP